MPAVRRLVRHHWPAVAAFVFLLIAMLGFAHVRYDPERRGFVRDGTMVARSGDEPHYLVIMNSLLFDHDLELRSDYRRGRSGGLELGARNAGLLVDHHTIVVDRTTGEHDLWPLVYQPERSVPWTAVGYARRDERFPPYHELVEVPAHPPAFPAMLAAVIAPFGPSIDTSERDAGWAMVFVSWLTAVLTYALGLRVFRARVPAMCAVGLLLCTPWLAYSRSYFSEPMIGLMLVAASFAFAERRIVLAAVAVSIATAIKAPFVLVAAAFVIDCAIDRRWRDALVLMATVGALGLGLAAFNFRLAGTPMIVGAGGSPPLGGLKSMYDTLLERDHGLICFVPWVPFAFLGLADSIRRKPSLSRAFAIATFFHFIVLSSSGFGPSDCFGPRYWVPLLPWFAIEGVRFFVRARPGFRVVAAAAMALGALISISGAALYTDSFMQAANRWW
jgi:hypothetical protein